MPWPEKQRRAIAASMRRRGKSPEEISRFFREHGYGHRTKAMHDASKRKRRK